MNARTYDLTIIGGGPAGMTAGIYAARKKLNFILITPQFGGQTLVSGEIENYLGYQLISGPELVSKFEEHIKQFEIEVEHSEVAGIIRTNEMFDVVTRQNKHISSTSVIIASGRIPRMLNVPGEKEYLGGGVTYCAICDAPLFSGKEVVVVGGGNSALDAALQLSKIATKVHIVSPSPWKADEVYQEQVKKAANVVDNTGYEVASINGNQFVESVVVEETNTKRGKTIPAQGVFIEIGSIPVIAFAKGLVDLNESGEVIVNRKSETSQPGVFAAGDVTNVPEKQIIIAAGEGAKAALAAHKYLIEHHIEPMH